MFSHIFGIFPVFSYNSKKTHQSFGLIKRVPQRQVTPNTYSDLFQTCARLPEIAHYDNHSRKIFSRQIVCRHDTDDYCIDNDNNQNILVNQNLQNIYIQ